MKKIKIFLLTFTFLIIHNSFSMFRKHILNKIYSQKIKSFHTTNPTPKTMDWEERIEIEKNLHEQSLLNNPKFFQKIANKQLSNLEPLLKEKLEKISEQNTAILKQNHIMFLHQLNDRVQTDYSNRENLIRKTQTDLKNLYEEYKIDINHGPKDTE